MANLKLQQKKSFSENNLRRFANILIGLTAGQESLASQCLTDYIDDGSRVYQRGNITIYNGYIWEAKTVAQGTFDESKWTKLADNFTELDLDTIKGFLGLTPEQLETMADLISTEIRLDKVFSSSDTYTRIDNALKEAKQYCLTQLASKSTGSFKKASSTAEVTDGNYLYLILNSVTSKYDIYALVDNNVELLTSVDVNLDDYFTKTEITDNYYDKTTSDGKYATITTVDNHISDTVAHMTQEEKDKLDTIPTDDEIKALIKNNENKVTLHHTGTESVFDFIDTNCTEGYRTYWIKFESTATDIPCDYGFCEIIVDSPSWIKVIAYDVVSKCTYIAIKENGTWNKTWTKIVTENDLRIGTKVDQSFIDIYGNDILKYPKGRYNIQTSGLATSLINLPNNNAGVLEISSIHEVEGNPFDTAWCHRIYKFEPFNGGLYIKTIQSNDTPGSMYVDTKWQRMATVSTLVPDVPITKIEFTNSNVSKTGEYEICKYYVKNGYAYVTLNALTFNSSYVSGEPFTTLPKPVFRFSIALTNAYNTVNLGRLFVEPNGEMHLYSNSIQTTELGYASFSYPVAEE